MNRIFIYIIFVFSGVKVLHAQHDLTLNKRITINLNQTTIEDAMKLLTQREGIHFTYFSSIADFKRIVNLSVVEMPLNDLLQRLFANTGLTYLILPSGVILKPTKPTVLKGAIYDRETHQPISFASVYVKKSAKGAVADENGVFSIQLSKLNAGDSISFIALGYRTETILAARLLDVATYKVYLKMLPIELPAAMVITYTPKYEELGNWSKRSSGALYLDTQGQQVALYISNTDSMVGRLRNIRCYLSSEGNTEAPIRIRLYMRDSVTGKPGRELLKPYVIVQPKIKNGWFTLNMAQFDITFPVSGLFVAIEGIYPFSPVYTPQSELESQDEDDKMDNEIDKRLVYGQKVGYNHKGDNNTWHYSYTRDWFQLKKRNFNVMISADVLFSDRKEKKHRFIFW